MLTEIEDIHIGSDFEIFHANAKEESIYYNRSTVYIAFDGIVYLMTGLFIKLGHNTWEDIKWKRC